MADKLKWHNVAPLWRWVGGESRYIVTIEVAIQDADQTHQGDILNGLGIAIEEGLQCLADSGIEFVGMSKPVELSNLADWTISD